MLRRMLKAGAVVACVLGVIATPSYACASSNSDRFAGDVSTLCRFLETHQSLVKSRFGSQDWPKTVNAIDVKWPVWRSINPLEKLDLIRKSIEWPTSRHFYGNAWTDQQYDAYWGTTQERDREWHDVTEPYYLSASKAGTLQMQATDITITISAEIKKATIIRFRIETEKEKSFMSKPVDINPTDNWRYLVENVADLSKVHDVPISQPLSPMAGELGVIDNHAVIFETLHFPSAQLESVDILPWNPSWPDDPNWSQYNLVEVSTTCGFKIH